MFHSLSENRDALNPTEDCACVIRVASTAKLTMHTHGSDDMAATIYVKAVQSHLLTRPFRLEQVLPAIATFLTTVATEPFIQAFVEARLGIIYAQAGHSSRWEGVKAGGAPRVQGYVHSNATFLAGVNAKANAAAVYEHCTALPTRIET
jgi:hypothetical protein